MGLTSMFYIMFIQVVDRVKNLHFRVEISNSISLNEQTASHPARRQRFYNFWNQKITALNALSIVALIK